MAKAFVLMTAMPPTTGHLQLVRFASGLCSEGVTVLICTQPAEPMANERVAALRLAVRHAGLTNVTITHFHETIAQDPQTPGFWQKWQYIMWRYGNRPGDYIVSSEPYGRKLAEITGGTFYPYDIDRSLNPVKATPVRNDPLRRFGDIIPEFQPYLRTRVTVFGAESTGKTTLSKALAHALNGQWLFEYARSYLENTVNEITVDSMTAIWRGQSALQRQAGDLTDSPYIIQDTDLFSTVGYWQFPHWQAVIDSCPAELVEEAGRLASDLYIVTRSNIPFEADPLRYGGNVREGSDAYWIRLLETFDLPHIVLDSTDRDKRLLEARQATEQIARRKAAAIAYDRHGL